MDFPGYNNWREWETEWHKALYRAKDRHYICGSEMFVLRCVEYTKMHDILKEMNS